MPLASPIATRNNPSWIAVAVSPAFTANTRNIPACAPMTTLATASIVSTASITGVLLGHEWYVRACPHGRGMEPSYRVRAFLAPVGLSLTQRSPAPVALGTSFTST